MSKTEKGWDWVCDMRWAHQKQPPCSWEDEEGNNHQVYLDDDPPPGCLYRFEHAVATAQASKEKQVSR